MYEICKSQSVYHVWSTHVFRSQPLLGSLIATMLLCVFMSPQSIAQVNPKIHGPTSVQDFLEAGVRESRKYPDGRSMKFETPGGEDFPIPDRLKLEKAWQTGSQCGPVSLHLLLKLSGKSVELDDVLKRIEVDPKVGCSMSDLESAARQFGLDGARVVKLTPEDLRRIPFPAIVHWDSKGTSSQGGGHFDVVTHRVEDGFFAIDTTNCVFRKVSDSTISSWFSGYALIIEPQSVWKTFAWAAFCVVAAVDLLLAVMLLRNKFKSR